MTVTRHDTYFSPCRPCMQRAFPLAPIYESECCPRNRTLTQTSPPCVYTTVGKDFLKTAAAAPFPRFKLSFTFLPSRSLPTASSRKRDTHRPFGKDRVLKHHLHFPGTRPWDKEANGEEPRGGSFHSSVGMEIHPINKQ